MVRLALLLVFLSGPALADLLSDGQNRREIPFQVIDHRALLEVTVDGQPGVMILDNGTPMPVMFNRDAATLSAGQEVARGNAASGQPIVVMVHAAPELRIAGQPFALDERVTSGNLGFVEEGFGEGFMGFIGAPTLAADPFVLDFTRQVMIVQGAESLTVAPDETLGQVSFSIWEDALPTSVAQVGDLALLLDFDTGDSGSIYLSAATMQAMVAAGTLSGGPGDWTLSSLRIGGMEFGPTPVQLIMAASAEDFRPDGKSDLLRLGARFLAENPVLWDFAAKELTFLTPDAMVLGR